MRILQVEQGSSEWHAARCGMPTSSNFDKIVCVDGKPSKQRTKYLYQLAGERLLGRPEETYQNGAMLRGIEMEEEARQLYQLVKDVEVVKVGVCVTEGKTIYAASPDGMVGDDGCIEIKCPMLSTHVSYLLDGGLPSDYFQQTQGQLLVTGRKWNDFISYYPSLRPLIVRVYRDEIFIKALEKELILFCLELEKIVDKIK